MRMEELEREKEITLMKI